MTRDEEIELNKKLWAAAMPPIERIIGSKGKLTLLNKSMVENAWADKQHEFKQTWGGNNKSFNPPRKHWDSLEKMMEDLPGLLKKENDRDEADTDSNDTDDH